MYACICAQRNEGMSRFNDVHTQLAITRGASKSVLQFSLVIRTAEECR